MEVGGRDPNICQKERAGHDAIEALQRQKGSMPTSQCPTPPSSGSPDSQHPVTMPHPLASQWPPTLLLGRLDGMGATEESKLSRYHLLRGRRTPCSTFSRYPSLGDERRRGTVLANRRILRPSPHLHAPPRTSSSAVTRWSPAVDVSLTARAAWTHTRWLWPGPRWSPRTGAAPGTGPGGDEQGKDRD